jgi:tRNA dimethylallyltransferase
VVRAVEKAMSDQPARPRKAASSPYDALVIGLTLPRQALYERVDRRIDVMVASGWVDEVRHLLAQGVSRDAPAMTGIGYREIASHLAGEITLGDAVAAARKATRRLIRHQYNWFKLNDPRVMWLEAGRVADEQAAGAILKRWPILSGE